MVSQRSRVRIPVYAHVGHCRCVFAWGVMGAQTRYTNKPFYPNGPSAPIATLATATATTTATATAAAAYCATMASLQVLAFDHEGRSVQFDTWLDELQLYLLSDIKDSVSLFDHVSGAATAPPATADSATRSQWLSRNAAARLAIRNHLPLDECAHFEHHRTAQALYEAVVARYSSPTTAALPIPRAPPMFITLYFVVTRLPDSLRSVRDHFLSLDPTSLTIDLLAAKTSAVAIGAARGTPRPPFFEGWSPSPLAPSYASAAAANGCGSIDGGGGSGSSGGGSSVGGGGCGTGGGSGGSGGGGGGSGGSGGSGGGGTGGGGTGARRVGSGGGHRQQQQRRSETQSPQQLREWFLRGASGGSCPAEGDCYRCVLPDPGIAAAALGASESGTLPGTAHAQALHTFTLDSGTSACFFRDSTTLTPLSTPVPVRLADPSGGPVVARSSTVLPCLAVLSGSISGLHLPSCSTKLVSTAALQDAMVTTTTPGGQRVTICTCTRTGHHLATFTRRPGSSLYTRYRASSGSCICSGVLVRSGSRPLLVSPPFAPDSSVTLLRLRGMHSRLLVSGLPMSLPPLPLSPAPPCLPCVEGRQRAAPHSSFPPTTAPLQTLHMDVWGPARVSGQSRERYFLLVVDDYTRYTTVFPLCSKDQAPREWHNTLRTTLAALGFAPSTADPSLFLRTDTLQPPFYVLVYVDDPVFATADTKALTLVKSELQKRHTCTGLSELRSYLGLQITWDRARRTITLTQSHMVHQVLQRFGFQFSSPQPTPLSISHSLSAPPSDQSVEPSGPYLELVGCLMYVMTCTRPDLAYPLSLLARYVALGRHRKVHWVAAKRVLRYLCRTSGMGLVLGGRGPVVLTGHADASWVDDSATQWSSRGYTFSLGYGSVSWQSTRSSSVLSSSCEAEIYAGTMAAQELHWLTYPLTDLGEQPRSPPILYVDNKAMIALC
ncbi:unnamed protein product [Closterium sp. NIES-54]